MSYDKKKHVLTSLQLTKIYDERERAIKRCIGIASEQVKELREIYQHDRDDVDAVRNLRNAQNKVFTSKALWEKIHTFHVLVYHKQTTRAQLFKANDVIS